MSAGSELSALLIHGHHGGLGSPKKDFLPWYASKKDTAGVAAALEWARENVPKTVSGGKGVAPAWPRSQPELDILLRLAYSALGRCRYA